MEKEMRSEPRGLTATFKVTKTYYVTCYGNTEEDCYIMAENLTAEDIDEDDFVEMEVEIKDGFEYDSF
jgi:hypothetical protein